ncbi:hypothetical protein [Streptomyces sp. NPDC015125]
MSWLYKRSGSKGEVTAVRGKRLPPGREPGETLVDNAKHKEATQNWG